MRLRQKHSNIALSRFSIVVILFVMSSTVLAQGDTWTQKADMPTARLGLATSVVNGKIYAIGGYQEANFQGLRTVEEYDPAINTWTTKANMPTGRRQLATSVVNGNIYAIGGYVNFQEPGLSIVEEYDPATNTWTQKTDMPTARLGLATSVVNGIIYAIGGDTGHTIVATVEAYDPLTDAWTSRKDMPTARFFLSTSVVDGKIYAIGGSYGSPNQVLSTVEAYDPATNTWTSKTVMPGPRWGLSTSTVNGEIYAIGGAIGGVILSTVEEYDPATDTWASLTGMPTPRGSLATSTVTGKIYAIGGALTFPPPHPGVTTVEEYTPPLASIHDIRLNSSYIRPGIDSLKIKCNAINSHRFDLQVNATIQSVDSTFIENRMLHDDGLHEDGQVNDGLWGGHLDPVSIENEFLLNITASDADSTDHILHSASERFTTIGPVVFGGYTFTGSDVVPNPGDGLIMKLTLKNEGLTATASNITTDLAALDTLSSVSRQVNPSYGNIPAQESAVTAGFYVLKIDENVFPGDEMHFRVDIASNGRLFWTDTFKIDIVTSVADPSRTQNIPTEFLLHQNYPNPFNPETAIRYQLSAVSDVELVIYNHLGQKIRTLVHARQSAGIYTVKWDGRDNSGRRVASGVYLYRLQGGGLVYTRKMVLVQ